MSMISTCVDALAHLVRSYLNTNAKCIYNRIYSAEGLSDILEGSLEYLLFFRIKFQSQKDTESFSSYMHRL